MKCTCQLVTDFFCLIETSPDVSATDLTLTSGRPGYNRMNSSKGAEWDRDEEENLALYGKKKYILCDIVIKEIDILYIIEFSLLFILKLDINLSLILLCSFLYLKYM